VEHSLGGVELGDWWKDTASVACKEDDVAGVVCGQARDLGVIDVLNWVGTVTSQSSELKGAFR